jgi:hypothetical protein
LQSNEKTPNSKQRHLYSSHLVVEAIEPGVEGVVGVISIAEVDELSESSLSQRLMTPCNSAEEDAAAIVEEDEAVIKEEGPAVVGAAKAARPQRVAYSA